MHLSSFKSKTVSASQAVTYLCQQHLVIWWLEKTLTQWEGINKQGEAMKSGGSETDEGVNNIVDDFKASVSVV